MVNDLVTGLPGPYYKKPIFFVRVELFELARVVPKSEYF